MKILLLEDDYTYKESIKELLEEMGYSVDDFDDGEKALDALAVVLKKQLLDGEALLIPGIGTFSVIQKAARLGRNPKTGETVEIPAKKSVKFKATKTLADAVNE